LAKLYIENIVKLHGVPSKLVSDHYATPPQLLLDGLTLKATYSVRQSDPKNI
jgi:hypothetical protein